MILLSEIISTFIYCWIIHMQRKITINNAAISISYIDVLSMYLVVSQSQKSLDTL